MNLKAREDKYNIAVVNFIFAQGYQNANRWRSSSNMEPMRDYHVFSSEVRSADDKEKERFFTALKDDPYGRINWEKLATREDTAYYSDGTFDDSNNAGWNFLVDIWDVDDNHFMFSYVMDNEDFGDLVNDLVSYDTTPESLSISYGLFNRRMKSSSYNQGGTKEDYYPFFMWEREGFPKLKCFQTHGHCKSHTQRQLEKNELRKLPSGTKAKYMAVVD
jgi:hypothetical protein